MVDGIASQACSNAPDNTCSVDKVPIRPQPQTTRPLAPLRDVEGGGVNVDVGDHVAIRQSPRFDDDRVEDPIDTVPSLEVSERGVISRQGGESFPVVGFLQYLADC